MYVFYNVHRLFWQPAVYEGVVKNGWLNNVSEVESLSRLIIRRISMNLYFQGLVAAFLDVWLLIK